MKMNPAKRLDLVRHWEHGPLRPSSSVRWSARNILKPSEMAAVGGSVSVVYAAWIAGGSLSLFGALSFAELGAALPEAGWQYAYLRKGLARFGDFFWLE